MQIVTVSFEQITTNPVSGNLSIGIDDEYIVSDDKRILNNGTFIIKPLTNSDIFGVRIQAPILNKESIFYIENDVNEFVFLVEQEILIYLYEINQLILELKYLNEEDSPTDINLIGWIKDILTSNSTSNDYWFNKVKLNDELYKEDNYYIELIGKLNKYKRIIIPQQEFEIVEPKPKYEFIDEGGFGKMFSSMESRREKSEKRFSEKLKLWEKENLPKINRNEQRKKNSYEINGKLIRKIESLNNEILEYKNQLSERQLLLDKLIQYYSEETDIISYFKKTIETSYPIKLFNLEFELDFIRASKHLILEVNLPTEAQIPNVKEVKIIKSTSEKKTVTFSSKEYGSIYNKILYACILRILHDISFSDKLDKIDLITANGWITGINKSNGHVETKCILSISTSKKDILLLNLDGIEPEYAFKSLKGISASQLINHTPIAPIISIDKQDKRFVAAENILHTVSSSTNIAAIGWEDFEHLIRELFEKEFAVNGGEVKVTQSSRDGGVDAIAFDPDPIRGGKIVIQSKRYTNVVGVSAIRDLYGTVLNEGATKGIIVTTSYFGQDAYLFASGKPLTLLDGNNLLHLLAKHGFNSRIDLGEAKKLNALFGDNHKHD